MLKNIRVDSLSGDSSPRLYVLFRTAVTFRIDHVPEVAGGAHRERCRRGLINARDYVWTLPAKNPKELLLIGERFLSVFDLATRYLHDN